MSSKDLLLSAIAHKELTPVSIPELPELDGKIYVRVLNAGERHLYGSTMIDAKNSGQVISDYEIAAICACEPDGTPMFHKRDADGRIIINSEEVNKLRLVDGRAIHAIALKAIEVSGMAASSKDEAKKNSESNTTTDSSSG